MRTRITAAEVILTSAARIAEAEAALQAGVGYAEARANARIAQADAEAAKEAARADRWHGVARAYHRQALDARRNAEESRRAADEASGHAMLWHSVVVDLLKGYSIPDIGEYLERAGLPACADCGGPLDWVGELDGWCGRCRPAAEAEETPDPEYPCCEHCPEDHGGHGGPCGLGGCQVGPRAEAATAAKETLK